MPQNPHVHPALRDHTLAPGATWRLLARALRG